MIYFIYVLMAISIAIPVISLMYFNPQVAMLELKVNMLELEKTLLESRCKMRDTTIKRQRELIEMQGDMADEHLKDLGMELPKLDLGRPNEQGD